MRGIHDSTPEAQKLTHEPTARDPDTLGCSLRSKVRYLIKKHVRRLRALGCVRASACAQRSAKKRASCVVHASSISYSFLSAMSATSGSKRLRQKKESKRDAFSHARMADACGRSVSHAGKEPSCCCRATLEMSL